MRKEEVNTELIAARIRLEALRLWKKNHGPLSGTLSIVDVYSVLFFKVFSAPYWSDAKKKVRFIPKSTSAFAFYATLKEAGLFDEEAKKHLPPVLRKDGWVGGVSSTLTKNFDQAIGMAIVSKFRDENYPVIVGLSEGDLQAGVSQQAKIASSFKLNNLAVILDCNQIQSSYTVNNADPTVIPDEDGHFPRLQKIWEGYGWDYREVGGHNHVDLEDVMRQIGETTRPLVIVVKTVKGKGVSFVERDPIRYIHKMSEEEFQEAVRQLEEQINHLNKSASSVQDSSPVYFHRHINEKIKLNLPALKSDYEEETTEKVFREWMARFLELNKDRAFVVDTDNPYPFPLSVTTYTSENKSQHISVGVNERMAVNIARGIANSGGFPIFGSPSTHIQITSEDFMRCAIDHDPVLLVSFRPGSDLGHWGLTHNSNRDCLLFSYPDSFIFQAATNEDVLTIFNSIYSDPYKYLPAYFRLPTRVFQPNKLGFLPANEDNAFVDGFYYFKRTQKAPTTVKVVFLASGTLLCECANAAITLENDNISSTLVNILNLTSINNTSLFNEIVEEADLVVSIIDADPLSLSSLIFKTILPHQRRKVITLGLNGFGRGIYTRDEILKHNGLDGASLVEVARKHLLKDNL